MYIGTLVFATATTMPPCWSRGWEEVAVEEIGVPR